MATLFDPPTKQGIVDRLATLTPAHEPRWGRMTAPQMMVHVTDQLRIAFGEIECKTISSGLVGRWPLKHLIVYVLPWPKGAPTAPELLEWNAREWSADRKALEVMIDRVSAAGPDSGFAPHPAFGRLSGRAWGVLSYRHLDHHFRQFGI